MRLVAIEPELARELSRQRRECNLAEPQERCNEHVVFGTGIAKRANEPFDFFPEVDDDARERAFVDPRQRGGIPPWGHRLTVCVGRC